MNGLGHRHERADKGSKSGMNIFNCSLDRTKISFSMSFNHSSQNKECEAICDFGNVNPSALRALGFIFRPMKYGSFQSHRHLNENL